MRRLATTVQVGSRHVASYSVDCRQCGAAARKDGGRAMVAVSGKQKIADRICGHPDTERCWFSRLMVVEPDRFDGEIWLRHTHFQETFRELKWR